jgi:hypothetical protein
MNVFAVQDPVSASNLISLTGSPVVRGMVIFYRFFSIHILPVSRIFPASLPYFFLPGSHKFFSSAKTSRLICHISCQSAIFFLTVRHIFFARPPYFPASPTHFPCQCATFPCQSATFSSSPPGFLRQSATFSLPVCHISLPVRQPASPLHIPCEWAIISMLATMLKGNKSEAGIIKVYYQL